MWKFTFLPGIENAEVKDLTLSNLVEKLQIFRNGKRVSLSPTSGS